MKSGPKNFEQVLTSLANNYLPTSQTPGDPQSRLDAALARILNETSRYLFFKNKHHEGNSTVEKKIENTEVSPEITDFSDINENQEISSIVINNSNIEQNKSYKASDIRYMRSNDSSGNSQNYLSLTNSTLQNGGNKKQLYKNSFK
ncbi:Protein of unknown function [Cotesia congregata]|uniref:Uncharacterized protein n=1 Tax=Cotesia congregata TaxID=51543 RepID=A0A8J2E9R0_COTCN|nr:Protein of unknown function [Cotesia congregata]